MRGKVIAFLSIFILAIVTACGGENSESNTTNETQNDSANDNEVITLRYSFFAPEATYPAVVMKEWAERVSERTNGKVEFEFYFGGSLLSADNTFEGIRGKVADLGLTGTSYFPQMFPLLEISDAPSSYPNAKVASKVVSDLAFEFEESLSAIDDLKVVKIFTTEPSYIQSRAPIDSLEAMKGKRLRITGSFEPIFESLGASPISMGADEAMESLQTGLVDGNVSERAQLKDFGFAELLPYVTDFNFNITTLVTVMNKDVWDSLPSEVQEVIEELKFEIPEFAGEYMDKQVQESIEWSKEEHDLEVIKLSDSEREKWIETTAPFQARLTNKAEEQGLPGKAYYDKLYELIEQYEGE